MRAHTLPSFSSCSC